LFVNPLVDLMGERVSVIPLESFEHLLQLACRTFAGGPPHRLTSKSWLPGGSDRTVSGRAYQIDGFLSSDSPGDPVSSGGVEREELGPLVGTGQPALSPFDGLRSESRRDRGRYHSTRRALLRSTVSISRPVPLAPSARSSPSTRPRHTEACSASGTSSARRTNDRTDCRATGDTWALASTNYAGDWRRRGAGRQHRPGSMSVRGSGPASAAPCSRTTCR